MPDCYGRTKLGRRRSPIAVPARPLEPEAYRLRSCSGGYRCRTSAVDVRKGRDLEQWGFSATPSRRAAGASTGRRRCGDNDEHPWGGKPKSLKQLVTRRRWRVAFTRPKLLPHIAPARRLESSMKSNAVKSFELEIGLDSSDHPSNRVPRSGAATRSAGLPGSRSQLPGTGARCIATKLAEQ